MRKCLILLLCVLLSLLIVGCNSKKNVTQQTTATPTTEPATVPDTTEAPTTPPGTIPADTALAGVQLDGMTAEEALDAVKAAMESYTIRVYALDSYVDIPASSLSVTLNEEHLAAYLLALANGEPLPDAPLAQCDTSGAKKLMEEGINHGPKNPVVKFSSDKKQFVVADGVRGVKIDATGVNSALELPVSMLQSSATAQVNATYTYPQFTSEEPAIVAAAEEANKYLTPKITLQFMRATVTLSPADLSKFVKISEDYAVSVNEEAISEYVRNATSKYSGKRMKGQFVTTYGTTLSGSRYEVDYYGADLDSAALKAELTDYVTNMRSATYAAVYDEEADPLPFGGNYVEVNLTSQCLWVYRDGVIVTQSDIVSGSVAGFTHTDPGVFKIFGKVRQCTLIGPTWSSYVEYWVPYNGGEGLHDASWRTDDEFGGDTYLYEGSHGCVNIPPANMPAIYDNVSIGTAVIVYGGCFSIKPLPQVLTGTDSYTCTTADAPFKLDVTVKYDYGDPLVYTSSDTNVVTVDENGNVTIVGAGDAEITVLSPECDLLLESSFTVTIHVEEAEETTDPETTVPETTVPETSEPETTVPETTVPETTIPETTVPETTVPETTVPETTVPETTVPETTVSETAVPET